MASYNRKMLVISKDKMAICLNCSPERCPSECGMVKLLAPPISPVKSENHHMPYYFVILLCVLGAIFVFICYMITLKKYKMNPRRNDEDFGGNSDDFVDENPDLDHHPIWFIHTIGLPVSVIESIPEFKYRKIDSLIDGIDCSVCLTEFEENESLRLLPKCSHAFHVPCIDTWLSSHMNCPVCRAPIVSDLNAALGRNNVGVSLTDVNGSSANEVNPVENGRSGNDLENQELDEEGNREMSVRDENLVALQNEEGKIVGILEKIHGVVDERGKGKGLRVSSDLAEHQVKINNVMQTALRSVSMDPSAVFVVHRAMSQRNLGNDEGCSNSNDQLAEEKTENSDAATKSVNRNLSLYEAMKSSSFGRSLQKVPIRMKRSFSTSGKCSVSTSDKEVKKTSDNQCKLKDVMQPALRSVSMDPSAISVIHRAISEMTLANDEESSISNDQLAEGKTENSDAATQRGNRNSSLYEAIKSSSFGRSLQKVPIRMKRSFSTSGKCSVSTTDIEVKNTSDNQCK